jgi:FkbM family methyltransferase
MSPMSARALARRTARRLLSSQGFELRRMDTADFGLDACLTRLLRETRTSVVLDVGANHGGFVDYVRGQGYEGRVLSFEPLPEPFATLTRRIEGDSRWEAIRVAISDAPGTATMRRSGKADVTSSLLATTDAMVGFLPAATPGEEVEVAVSTVDEQVEPRGPPLPEDRHAGQRAAGTRRG